ncbi:MAG: SufS family cysteine desulfurase [Tidjanibacter sp.]|nr:SufS family cysteine desulfurase [Tidjanibacter sp.]
MAFDVEKIRAEFPLLSREVYGRPLVYLDNAATSQKPQCVIDRVAELYRRDNSNIHRGVHFLAEHCTELYEEARHKVAEALGTDCTGEVIFTAGATAAINLVAYSFGEQMFHAGDNIIVSEMEHHSNIVPWQLIAERKGVEIRVLPFDDEGNLLVDRLTELLDSRTRMVAVTQASNVLGTMPDIDRVVALAHAAGAAVMIDGCQGFVHGEINVRQTDCDFYAFSSHKLYGPNGVGVLYGKRKWLEQMPPFLCGGDMVRKVTFPKTTYADLPLKFEAGTANYIDAIGLATAIDFLRTLDRREVADYERSLLDYATESLQTIEGLRIYGTTPNKCSIVSFNVEGIHNFDLGSVLDRSGVAVRTGAHCADPVMAHYGVQGMVRASFAFYNTREEVDALYKAVQKAVKMLK